MEPSNYLKAVDSYGNTMYRIARSYCRCHADAEDIVQSAFEKLLMAKVEFQDEQHLKKWLIRVTVNEAKNLCASFWKRHMVPWENSQTSQAYDFSYPEQSDLYDAVQKLPIKYRSVVHLYYYEDYSIKEIADILKLRETTVQTQLMRARKKLKEILKEDWQDE